MFKSTYFLIVGSTPLHTLLTRKLKSLCPRQFQYSNVFFLTVRVWNLKLERTFSLSEFVSLHMRNCFLLAVNDIIFSLSSSSSSVIFLLAAKYVCDAISRFSPLVRRSVYFGSPASCDIGVFDPAITLELDATSDCLWSDEVGLPVDSSPSLFEGVMSINNRH